MSNATSNATIGLAIDPSSLISSCELGSMGGSAAAQRYIELLEKDVLRFGFSSREFVLMNADADRGGES